ncbi:MAG TPA: hypothetical protein VHE79_05440, partial [Spirochaetia bacterium]
MTYEEFRSAFMEALKESRLGMIGLWPEEKINLRTTNRALKVYLEPLRRSDAEPFHVAATISWCWDSLLTARSETKEEDMLTELFRREAADMVPELPHLRVDLKLNASMPWGKPLPMPTKAAWSSWAREVMGRLESIEPLTPDEHVRESPDGNLEVLAWQGSPKAELSCSPTGELQLEGVSIEAMQIMTLPRTLDSNEPPDDAPREQLQDMFHRVRAALTAWSESLDHLKKG